MKISEVNALLFYFKKDSEKNTESNDRVLKILGGNEIDI